MAEKNSLYKLLALESSRSTKWFHDLGHQMNSRGSRKGLVEDLAAENIPIRAPIVVLLATALYVFSILFLVPSLAGRKRGFPTDKLFFLFCVFGLISNFYLFLNSFLLAQSQSASLKCVLALIHGSPSTSICICWVYCWYRVMQFFQEAFRIFSLEDDNLRVMASLYHILKSLLKPWVVLNFPPGGLLVTLVYIHSFFDFAISTYFSLAPMLCQHFGTKKPAIEYYVIIFIIWQHLFVMYQANPMYGKRASEFSPDLRLWLVSYCIISICILGFILGQGVETQNTDPRLSTVRFTPYGKR